jgi:putative hydrolase of the HAD superfamily
VIEAIVFDLDNCLAAADEPGRGLLEPMFAAIREVNRGRLSDAALAAAFDDCWRLALDVVAERHGFSEEMLAAGWEAGRRIAVTVPMRGYPDIDVVPALPARVFVVTSGFRRLQESKIAALGLRAFAEAAVDAIDEPGRKGKHGMFAAIAAGHRLEPSRVLVVGDNPASEIEAGNRLGMPTVQILRPGVVRGPGATHYVDDLHELRSRFFASASSTARPRGESR